LFRGAIDSSLAWTPDGRHLLFGIANRGAGTWTVEAHRIAAAGGSPEKLDLTIEALGSGANLRLHPDGRRLAFAASAGFNGELWVMENVLAPLKRDR
jgi:hypothetical protein